MLLRSQTSMLTTSQRTIQRHTRSQATPHSEADLLATEIPVALQYNGISHAVILATPDDLEDLAYGFSFTEGIIRQANDIYDLQIHSATQGISIDIEIASACLYQLKQRRRQLAGRTGCGLCGLESLTDVRRDLSPVPAPTTSYQSAAIFHALDQLKAQQPIHQLTGATHASAWTDLAGDLQLVREDVGRHNALDKLIGHLLRENISPLNGMMITSSRASFEMVQKTAAIGCPILIAVSAPTHFAVDVATELGLLLVGFGREQHFSTYSHHQYLAK